MLHATHVDHQRQYYRKTQDSTFFSVKHVALAVLSLASNLDFRPSLANVQRSVQKLHNCWTHFGHNIICIVVVFVSQLLDNIFQIFCGLISVLDDILLNSRYVITYCMHSCYILCLAHASMFLPLHYLLKLKLWYNSAKFVIGNKPFFNKKGIIP